MSFSSEIKKELNKTSSLSNKNLVKFELLGYLISGNIDLNNTKKEIKFSTESDYNINRFSKLLDNLKIEHKIQMEGNLFVITFNFEKIGKIQTKEKSIIINLDLFFENIKELKPGDKIIYYTDKGKREYKVVLNKIIQQTDWTYIEDTSDNRVTLITCVENMNEYRRCVQAVEII